MKMSATVRGGRVCEDGSARLWLWCLSLCLYPLPLHPLPGVRERQVSPSWLRYGAKERECATAASARGRQACAKTRAPQLVTGIKVTTVA